MIVRMSKVEIIAPQDDLIAVLDVLREMGILHLDTDASSIAGDGSGLESDMPLIDEKSLDEQIMLEELRVRIDELLSQLPTVPPGSTWLDPSKIVEMIAETIQRHLPACRSRRLERETRARELSAFESYRLVLDRIAPLMEKVGTETNLEFVGLVLENDQGIEQVARVLTSVSGEKFEIITGEGLDGSRFALVAIPRPYAEKVRTMLEQGNFPEMSFPEEVRTLPFPQRLLEIARRMEELEGRIEALDRWLGEFAQRWGRIYAGIREWLGNRLALLQAAVSVHRTGMCVCINGWMPTSEVPTARGRLNEVFAGRAVLSELAILEHDLERIPVIISNPTYFRSFEIFTRLLPLPRYTSYDPTPFLGIFFPIFFGMMLGDAGYGVVIFICSLALLHATKKEGFIADAARIARISSVYTIIFGIIYGEFLGNLGSTLLGLTSPFRIERRIAIIPTLYFALSVGVMHVTLALVLGLRRAIRKGSVKETVYSVANIALILALTVAILALASPGMGNVLQPALVAIGVAVPLILVTGGLLAPLEMVKNIGNIISYARIMAIGLASVFIAYAANILAGKTGDIVSGIVVGALIHLLSIVLGIFSPTIHALRLHYVEFFSKFMEEGGRRFDPLKK